MPKKQPEPTTADLRDAILKRMGPLDHGFYASGAAALLDAYVAKEKASWEFGERLQVEQRFMAGVRLALANPPFK